MKFKIDNLLEYEGEDLIFLIGTPGSRWSKTAELIGLSPDINITDRKPDREWHRPFESITGEKITVGNHVGAYWGPGNLFGKNFDYIHSLSKQDLLTEFMAAFDTWDKIKIIKSHWFAYNIPYLNNMFPKAKIVLSYMPDHECFYWWQKCGGFGSGYANYSWYENDERMLEQIKEENSHILKFGINKNLSFLFLNKKEIWDLLELSHPPIEKQDDVFDRSKIIKKTAIYTSRVLDTFEVLR